MSRIFKNGKTVKHMHRSNLERKLNGSEYMGSLNRLWLFPLVPISREINISSLTPRIFMNS